MPWSASNQFEDPEFPAEPKSLGPLKALKDVNDVTAAVQWKRPGEFVVGEQGNGPFTLFPADGIDPGDVCQRMIGDCWLLSALSTLAMTPEWIHRAFESPVDDDGTPCLNSNGKYVIRIFDAEQSKFVSIAIDDRIPCYQIAEDKWNPLGVTIKTGAIWPALLEKAVAKFFGSYSAIEGGLSDWVLTAFTGHLAACYNYNMTASSHLWSETHTAHKPVKDNPCRVRALTMKTTDNNVNTGMLFVDVRDWLASEEYSYVIGAGSNAGSDTTNIQGLALGHAYGVLGVYPCEQGFTLVKLRNPWGTGEWQGSWSDGDKLWERYPEIAEEVGYEPGNDGIFFMCTEDLTQLFDQIYYVRLPPSEVPEEDDKPDPELEEWYGEDEDEDENEDDDEEEEDEDTLAEIERVFDMFDMDGSGTLSQKELTKGLRSVGFSKKQIQEALEAVDEDGDGKITFEEFKQWYVDNDIQIDDE